MREISLRKAHQIQLELDKIIKDIRVETACRIDEFHNIESLLTSSRKTAIENHTRKVRLLEVLYSIRDKVDAINCSSGINKALTNIAKINRQISAIEDVIKSFSVPEDLHILKARQQKINELGKEASISQRFIASSVFLESDIEEMKDHVATIKKIRASLTDTVLEANIKHTIILDESEISTLLKERLL